MGGSAMDSPSGSVFSGSESSENSSPSPAGASSSRGSLKKRKVSQTPTGSSQPRAKRLKPFYRDKYRELFNETVNEAASGEPPDEELLPPCQVGATFWSAEEKEILFSALGKKGRHDLQGISADIGSKSDSEVRIYLQLLETATADLHAYGPSNNVVKITEIEAAAEVSQDCSAALDLAAEALSALQQKQEEKLESKQHPKLWQLTPKIAKWADRRLDAGEEGQDEVSRALPAATLVNLNAFLTLSKHFFMNSSVPENNWRNYTERRKSPSIMYTAFSDFHTLAVSITKRLIQSSLFFSMSRLRAMDASGHYTNRRHVKRRDVVAALNVLGMEANGRKTWTATARKCRLRVYEKVRFRQVWGKRYSYDEVEAILASSSVGTRGRYRRTSKDTDDVSKPQEQELDRSSIEDVPGDDISSDPSSGDEGGSSAVSDDADLMESSASHNDKQASKSELFLQSQDDYAEALDQQTSRKEESCLWESLGENPAEKMGTKDVQLPKVLNARSQGREDRREWTSWVDYVGDWEKLETPVPASTFVVNRRLGRNRDLATGLTDFDSSSVDSDGVESSGRNQLSDEFIHDRSSSGEQSSMDDLDAASDHSEEQDETLQHLSLKRDSLALEEEGQANQDEDDRDIHRRQEDISDRDIDGSEGSSDDE
ncbi:hypothetical protein ABVK25_008471 [Lepraria finkii]|uniref:Myb-like domain-containing protein n=1 Tax=Lepraria finkii TaxID=1340010 RepID=A0ABR4B002_9LECA